MNEKQLQALVKSASDKMRADDNTKNAIKYLEHLSWLLFLKVLEKVEDDRELLAQVDGRPYERVIRGEYRWSEWAQGDLTGPELTAWVNDELFPYLRGRGGSPVAEKVAEIFAGVTTVMKSGFALAEVLERVDKIDFHAVEDSHAMSVIYEVLLAQTSDAGWSGEFYTPRPVVETMVDIVQPTKGETIYDPCSGSCGFLVAAAEYVAPTVQTGSEREHLSRRALFGQEAGELAYLVGTMNLMLHGIEEPQTTRRNTLEQDSRNFDPSEQHDLVLTALRWH